MRVIRGRTAFITGAASGIGRAIALRLAREGANLFLVDIDESCLAEVVSETRHEGVESIGHHCDLGCLTQLTNAANLARARLAAIDILVNNAGIAYFGDTAKMSAADVERLLAINLHAPIHLTCELLPTLLSREESHVVNVASFLGLVGTRRLSLYTSSKFGLVGFSESLRAEYGRSGLGVTALCPGFVDTRLFASAPLGRDRKEPKLPPAWLLASPDKIADRTVRAIYRNRAVEVPQLYARLAYLGKRLVPGVLDWANHLSRGKRRSRDSETETTASAKLRKVA